MKYGTSIFGTPILGICISKPPPILGAFISRQILGPWITNPPPIFVAFISILY